MQGPGLNRAFSDEPLAEEIEAFNVAIPDDELVNDLLQVALRGDSIAAIHALAERVAARDNWRNTVTCVRRGEPVLTAEGVVLTPLCKAMT